MGRPRGPEKCSITDCENPGPYRLGWCPPHYIRNWRYGDPLATGADVQRECDTCGQTKPLTDFHKRATSARATTTTCTECRRSGARPKTVARQREWTLRTKYGITVEEYDRILAEQGGGCAICGRPDHGKGSKPLHVDHCHETGEVRGILCASCNRALGYLQDDPERLLRAAEYLTRRRAGGGSSPAGPAATRADRSRSPLQRSAARGQRATR